MHNHPGQMGRTGPGARHYAGCAHGRGADAIYESATFQITMEKRIHGILQPVAARLLWKKGEAAGRCNKWFRCA